MPILALEGPDRTGKTTAFEALRCFWPNAVFVPRLCPEAIKCMPLYERHEDDLWRALYDPAKFYVFDRHFAISGLVYSELYGRQLLIDPYMWADEMLVAYFCIVKNVTRPDAHFSNANYERLFRCYEKHVPRFNHFRCKDVQDVLQNASAMRMARAAPHRSVT